MGLKWGGAFEFDAVSEDESIIACISSSAFRTRSGRPGIGKVMKIKSDTLYLTNTGRKARSLFVFTEPDMYEYFRQLQEAGRFPEDVEILLAILPEALANDVKRVRQIAAAEVSPQ